MIARVSRYGSEGRFAARAPVFSRGDRSVDFFVVLDSPYATSRPGVYAVGDVRSGSVKRVASGVGEGSVVVQSIHRYLNPASV